jgi:hypothetical protein
VLDFCGILVRKAERSAAQGSLRIVLRVPSCRSSSQACLNSSIWRGPTAHLPWIRSHARLSTTIPPVLSLVSAAPTCANTLAWETWTEESVPRLCLVCYQHFVLQGDVSLLKSNFGDLADIRARNGCVFCQFLYRNLAKKNDASSERRSKNTGDVKKGCWIRTYMLNPTEVAIIYNGVTQFEWQLLRGKPEYSV